MNARIIPALRPMLPADAPLLVAIFRAAIEELTTEDYTQAQQEAWMSAAANEAEFAARRARELTLVATIAHAPVGFASMRDNDHIETLYMHPRAAGQGVGRALCEALETLARARGTARIGVDASDTARPFFAHRGYIPTRRNTVETGGEWLGNTTMEKNLAPVERDLLQ